MIERRKNREVPLLSRVPYIYVSTSSIPVTAQQDTQIEKYTKKHRKSIKIETRIQRLTRSSLRSMVHSSKRHWVGEDHHPPCLICVCCASSTSRPSCPANQRVCLHPLCRTSSQEPYLASLEGLPMILFFIFYFLFLFFLWGGRKGNASCTVTPVRRVWDSSTACRWDLSPVGQGLPMMQLTDLIP